MTFWLMNALYYKTDGIPQHVLFIREYLDDVVTCLQNMEEHSQ